MCVIFFSLFQLVFLNKTFELSVEEIEEFFSDSDSWYSEMIQIDTQFHSSCYS